MKGQAGLPGERSGRSSGWKVGQILGWMFGEVFRVKMAFRPQNRWGTQGSAAFLSGWTWWRPEGEAPWEGADRSWWLHFDSFRTCLLYPMDISDRIINRTWPTHCRNLEFPFSESCLITLRESHQHCRCSSKPIKTCLLNVYCDCTRHGGG